jgi:hypothetical protein
MTDTANNPQKREQYSHQVRISYPKNDTAVTTWIKMQYNLSSSFRMLIKNCIEEHGFVDYLSAIAPRIPSVPYEGESENLPVHEVNTHSVQTSSPPVQTITAAIPAQSPPVQPAPLQNNQDAASMLASMMETSANKEDL